MRIIAIGFVFALAATTAAAQQSPAGEAPLAAPAAQSATAASVAPVQPAGPTIESAAAGFRVSADKNAPLAAAAQVRRGQGKDVALMVVGVGAMVVGAIVGNTAGTIILIGGAAMALWGLYNYLE